MDEQIPFEAAKAGDPAARSVVDWYLHYLGIAVTNMIDIFRPEQLILGRQYGETGGLFA